MTAMKLVLSWIFFRYSLGANIPGTTDSKQAAPTCQVHPHGPDSKHSSVTPYGVCFIVLLLVLFHRRLLEQFGRKKRTENQPLLGNTSQTNAPSESRGNSRKAEKAKKSTGLQPEHSQKTSADASTSRDHVRMEPKSFMRREPEHSKEHVCGERGTNPNQRDNSHPAPNSCASQRKRTGLTYEVFKQKKSQDMQKMFFQKGFTSRALKWELETVARLGTVEAIVPVSPVDLDSTVPILDAEPATLAPAELTHGLIAHPMDETATGASSPLPIVDEPWVLLEGLFSLVAARRAEALTGTFRPHAWSWSWSRFGLSSLPSCELRYSIVSTEEFPPLQTAHPELDIRVDDPLPAVQRSGGGSASGSLAESTTSSSCGKIVKEAAPPARHSGDPFWSTAESSPPVLQRPGRKRQCPACPPSNTAVQGDSMTRWSSNTWHAICLAASLSLNSVTSSWICLNRQTVNPGSNTPSNASL
ncbi:uncharacterized protein V6R79_017241 [Siganus canaliculatus]